MLTEYRPPATDPDRTWAPWLLPLAEAILHEPLPWSRCGVEAVETYPETTTFTPPMAPYRRGGAG